MRPKPRHLEYAWLATSVALVVAILIPYWTSATPSTWDANGHMAAAWHVQHHWPAVHSWNPHAFAGYPQNLFYPPLTSWVMATIGFLTGIDAAYIILISAALLATPIAFFAMARAHGLGKEHSGAAAALLVALLAYVLSYDGGNFLSTLETGIIGAAAALPLLFLYAALLPKLFEEGTWKTASIVFTLILLTNVFATVMAGILFAASALARVKRIPWKTILIHVLATAGLSAFWWIPLISRIAETSVQAIRISWLALTLLEFMLPLASLTLLAGMPREQKTASTALVIAMIAVFAVVALGFILPFSFHYYRLRMFIYIFFPIVLLARFPRKGMAHAIAIGAILIFVLSWHAYPGYTYQGNPHVKALPEQIPGRTVVIEERQPTPLVLSNEIQRTGRDTVNGLFIESTHDAGPTLNLLRYFDPHARFWGGQHVNRLPNMTDEQALRAMHAYAVAEIISDIPLNASILPTPVIINTTLGADALYVYRLKPAALAEPLSNRTYHVLLPPERMANAWLRAENTSVWSDAPMLEPVPAAVSGMRTEDDGSRLLFHVQADEPAPILIHVGYSKDWHATAGGRPVRIYRATPSHMLIVADGDVTLEYRASAWHYLGGLISIASLLIVAFIRK